MKIVSIGDSFTRGDELPGTENNSTYISHLSWTAQLANLLNCQAVNFGKSGCSNERIIKRAIDVTLSKSADIIIVAWSNPVRTEFVDHDGLFSAWPTRNIEFMSGGLGRRTLIKTLAVNETTEIIRYHHRKWLRQILMLQALFEKYNQRYIMIQSHESQNFNRQWIVKSNLNEDLSRHIDTTYFCGWPTEGIVEWAGDAPRGKNGHPLELGHQRVAEKINEYIRNLGWLP